MIDDIIEAAEFFNLGQHASIDEINGKYKEMLFKWHPDRCIEDPEQGKLMTIKTVSSYRTLMSYCLNYEFSFLKEDLVKTSVIDDPEEFWNRKFGHDPLWGYPE